MAFASLRIQAQIWENAGLSQILVPESFKIPGQHSDNQAMAAVPVPSRKKEKKFSKPEKGAILHAAPKENIQAFKENISGWKAIPLQKWPVEWQEQFKKTGRGNFAWTYLELGQDLANANQRNMGQTEKDSGRTLRGNFLRSLFKMLSFPAGSHCLWPVSLHQASQPDEQLARDLFWSGIGLLECRGVIIFGSGAAKIAFPGKSLKPLSCFHFNGVLAVVLWDINGLIERPSMHGSLGEYLRSCLRQIG